MADNPKWCHLCDMYYHDCYCDDNYESEEEDNPNNSDEDDDRDKGSGAGGFLGVDFPYVPGDPFW